MWGVLIILTYYISLNVQSNNGDNLIQYYIPNKSPGGPCHKENRVSEWVSDIEYLLEMYQIPKETQRDL